MSIAEVSTMPLPGIPEARVIRVERLPIHLAGAFRVGLGVEAKPGATLINVPRMARFLVTNGVSIEVAPMPRAEPAAVDLFLDVSARAALIHQRGELPLLSTTIVSPEGRAVALCGFTGIGKSAIAAVLTMRGWSLLAEGVTRLVLEGTNIVAYPSHSELRLWHHTCRLLNINMAGLRRTRAGFEKFYVPVAEARNPLHLEAVICIRPSRETFIPKPTLTNEEMVEEATYKSGITNAINRTEDYRKIVGSLLSQCRVTTIEGGRDLSLDTLADAVQVALE